MSAFEQENDEIPNALAALVDFYGTPTGRELLDTWRDMVSGKRSVVFLGMGTSEFTPRLVLWHLLHNGIRPVILDAGEWKHYGMARLASDTLLVMTSQSGESVEFQSIVDSGDPKEYVAITNQLQSTLAANARLVLPMMAGEEAAITTKTYVNNLALLMILAETVTGTPTRALEVLRRTSDAVRALDSSEIDRAAQSLLPADHIAFVARGAPFVSAQQCALTFMEGLKRTATPFTGGAFRHGPFESMGPSFRLVLFRQEGPTAHLIDRLADDARRLDSAVVLFSDTDVSRTTTNISIRVPSLTAHDCDCPTLFPILAARSHNRLLSRLAGEMGISLGSFNYGSKVTTRE